MLLLWQHLPCSIEKRHLWWQFERRRHQMPNLSPVSAPQTSSKKNCKQWTPIASKQISYLTESVLVFTTPGADLAMLGKHHYLRIWYSSSLNKELDLLDEEEWMEGVDKSNDDPHTVRRLGSAADFISPSHLSLPAAESPIAAPRPNLISCPEVTSGRNCHCLPNLISSPEEAECLQSEESIWFTTDTPQVRSLNRGSLISGVQNSFIYFTGCGSHRNRPCGFLVSIEPQQSCLRPLVPNPAVNSEDTSPGFPGDRYWTLPSTRTTWALAVLLSKNYWTGSF